MIVVTAHPATTTILDALVKLLQLQFDFRKRVSTNVELLQVKNTKVKAFGLEATEAQIVLTVMANVENAAEQGYGRAFRAPLEAIRNKYAYYHKHEVTSLKDVLDLLATADTHRRMRDATAPTELQANALSSTLAALRGLFLDPDDATMAESSVATGYETVYAATSDDSNTSIETYAERRHCQKKEKKKKEQTKEKKKKKKRRDTDKDNEINDCPHCKKHNRRKAHPHIPHERFMWNKRYKGYLFKSVCDELEVPFKPRAKFMSALGGYRDAGSESESG